MFSFDFKYRAVKHLPFGRVPEYLARLTDSQKQRTARRAGASLGDNETVRTWPTRYEMVRAIRTEEKNAPASKWTPIVPLGITEGYR